MSFANGTPIQNSLYPANQCIAAVRIKLADHFNKHIEDHET